MSSSAAIRGVGEPRGKAGALRVDPAVGLNRERGFEVREALLVERDRRHPRARLLEHPVERFQAGGRDPKRARHAALGSDPLHGIAEATHRLSGGHPAAGVGEPFDRLLQLPRSLSRAFGCVDAEPVVTQPCGGAEDRLVDAEVEPSGCHGPSAAQLVGELGSAELEHLHRLLTCIQPPGHPDAPAVIELVRQRQAVPAARPGFVPGPVAALDRTSLAAGVDAVQRGAHGTEQRRLTGLVAPGDDRDPWMEILGQVVQRPETRDLETLEDHRSPISAPDSAMRP